MAKKNKKSAVEFPEPMSRNEAILQNILGADNDLLEPMSRIETLLIALGEKIDALSSSIPAAPTTDGTYTLTCVVADGEPTYSWETE